MPDQNDRETLDFGTEPPVKESGTEWDHIAPGVRDLVRDLNERGYQTTDSGDGSNYAAGMECALEYRHVAGVIPEGVDVATFAHKLKEIYPDYLVQVDFNPDQKPAGMFHIMPDGFEPAKLPEPERKGPTDEDVANLFYADLQHRLRQTEIWGVPGGIAIMVKTMEKWVADKAEELVEE